MKAGIYITGLAQHFVNESVEKYAERFMNEMNYATSGTQYELKSENVNYSSENYSTIAIILEKETQKPVYKFYEFKYNEFLTEKFNNYSLLVKNLFLLLLVCQKFPKVVGRMINRQNYSRPYQALYLFTILGFVALSVLFMLPALLEMAIAFFNPGDKSTLLYISEAIVSITALILLVVPTANIIISGIATEFVCANDYIQRGSQKQLLQGNLEKLIEYISEHETECKIHLHSYSFGSILALDYIYPFGNKVTANTQKYCEAIITIGTPVELIESYYTDYYKNRCLDAVNIQWINVYSINDALATNFRKDANIGEAEFGIPSNNQQETEIHQSEFEICAFPKKPQNVNYEVVTVKQHGFIDGLMLSGIKAHGSYWDKKTEGQSCLRLIYNKMQTLNLIE